jgi:carboxymethylenebutenolidase
MTARWETVAVADRNMRAYVGVPDRPGPHPVVLIAQHAGGVDFQMQDAVHRLMRAGYVVAAPELFHRQPDGLEPLKRIGLLRDDEIIADMDATLAHLAATRVPQGPAGVIGFCMGGRVAYLMAGANPALRASVVFYGGSIAKALGDGPSPLERTAAIACPLLGLFGADDTNPSPADVAAIGAELTRHGKWHEFHTYRDAGHAFENFTNPERYRERAARAAWGEMLAFLDERLRRAA